MRLALLFASLVLLAPVTAGAAERAVEWQLADGERLPRADAESVHISFAVDACGTNQDAQRVELAESTGVLAITVLDEEPEGAEICPAVVRIVEREVELGGKLGRRSLVDGSTQETVVRAEVPSAWAPANKALPVPGQRRLAILITESACGAKLDRTEVRRRRGSITITVLRREDTNPSTPACGAPDVQRRITVSLRGKLGRRSICDGSSSPPRVVFPRTKRA